MPANEFEKHVQERLDDFQLNPSAAVWKNVEALIRKRKKRRIFLLFLIPLVCGLGGTITYFTIHKSTEKSFVKKSVNAEVNGVRSTLERKNTEDRDTYNNPGLSADSTGSASSQIIEENKAELNSGSTNHQQTEINFSVKSTKPSRKTNEKKNSSPKGTELKEGTQNDLPLMMKDVLTTNPNQPTTQAIQQITSTTNTDDQQQENIIDLNTRTQASTDVKIAGQNDSTSNNNSIDSLTQNVELKKQRPIVTSRKWQFGVEGAVGISSIRTEILSVSVLSPAFDYYPNIPGVGSGGQQSVLPPSAIRPGAAFSIGAVASRRLSGKLNMNVGLKYSYSSTNIRIGQKKDTSIIIENGGLYSNTDRYYAGGPIHNFTNSYHSVRLPVSLQWRPISQLPIYVSFGGSVGYLMGTNALIYNESMGGVYFHDKKAFNRFQYGLNAGISYGVRMKYSELQIGPSLSLDMSGIAKENYDNKGYLIFGGLNLRYVFSEKKRR